MKLDIVSRRQLTATRLVASIGAVGHAVAVQVFGQTARVQRAAQAGAGRPRACAVRARALVRRVRAVRHAVARPPG